MIDNYIHMNPNAPSWRKHWSSDPQDHPAFTLNVRGYDRQFVKIARQMGIEVDTAVADAAFYTADLWRRSVRVDTGQYQDSIEVVKIGLSSYQVASDIPWSRWNEFGSVTIVADHAALVASLAGEEYLKGRISEAISRSLEAA